MKQVAVKCDANTLFPVRLRLQIGSIALNQLDESNHGFTPSSSFYSLVHLTDDRGERAIWMTPDEICWPYFN